MWLSHAGARFRRLLLHSPKLDQASYDCGRVEVALQLLTQMKIFEGVGGRSLLATSSTEMATMIQTFLQQEGLWEAANHVYKELSQPTRFVPEPLPGRARSAASEPPPSSPDSADASPQQPRLS